ncbi:perlucin-like protein [Mytilus edulis]|uniref:perlucin-like protein n=1 Tax=Mytilus edulis TaxID=6550 RepID=UPI0039EE9F78
MIYLLVLVLIPYDVLSLPCLTTGSKKDFDDSRKALTALKSYLDTTVNTLETDVQKTVATLKGHIKNVDGKIKTLDNDLKMLESDFKARQWQKYNGHCYYFGTDMFDWFTSERKCREIGGYIVKIDDSSENSWVKSKRPKKNSGYWIGLTDLKEGQFRWSYDQSLMTYKNWYPSDGWGSKGQGSDCVLLNSNANAYWLDYNCTLTYYYICESDFCF